MKLRSVTALLIVFLFLFTSAANATVFQWGEGDLYQQLKAAFGTTTDGHNHDGTNSRSLGTAATDPIFATNVTAAGFKQGVTTNVSTESTLTSAALAYGFISMISNSDATKTIGLNDGVPGQMVTIKLTLMQVNTIVISKASFPVTTHSYGWTTITFDTQGDFCTLLFLDTTHGWVVVYNSGCTIA